MAFKIGDKIIALRPQNYNEIPIGVVGTITFISGDRATVRFPESLMGKEDLQGGVNLNNCVHEYDRDNTEALQHIINSVVKELGGEDEHTGP